MAITQTKTKATYKRANNNRPDRGENRKAGNEPKLSAGEKREVLARQLGLKPRTKAFVDKLLENEGMSQTEAYQLTHPNASKTTAGNAASLLLRKPSVIGYKDAAVKKAKNRIVQLVDSKNESIALKAGQDILDRNEGKALQKNESISRVVEVKLDLTGVRIGAHYLTPDQLLSAKS